MNNANESNNTSRRQLITRAGMVGAVALGAGLMSTSQRNMAFAALQARYGAKGHRIGVNDVDIFNFALNLEYLEAEYYNRGVYGTGLPDSATTGTGTLGAVTGGTAVTFTNPDLLQFATEIAADEMAHVLFIRDTLGKEAIARPAIDLQTSFTKAAIAAGVITSGQTFDPFANDANFFLGAFMLEDVGVTAYHGAAPYIQKPDHLSAAAGILAVEGYHSALLRSQLFILGQSDPTIIVNANLIATALQTLSSAADDGTPLNPPNPETEQAITDPEGRANVVPTDANGLAFARTFAEVLNIVYLGGAANGFGFFPNKVNGRIA